VKPAKKRALIVFAATLAIGLGVAGWVVFTALRYGDTPAGTARGRVEIEVPKGATARDVAERLSAAGLIERSLVFRIYAGQRGASGRFKAGRYELQAPATPRQILDALVKGAADELVSVTIPEGKNLVEVAEILENAGVASKPDVILRATDPTFVASLGLPGVSLEGYLFPDTYKLRPRSTAAKALVPMVRRHRQVWDELTASHAKGVQELKRTYAFDDAQIVTLASIVEKETGQPFERPRIAQVFLNRLHFPTFRPKLLQTDPTIIYGCTVGQPRSSACLKWDGRIHSIQLQDKENPYNTYTHEGLPPGPIANPGRAALEAVLAPDKTPFLYFVSKNDGTHYFSKTVAEHTAAVVKYQRGGKAFGAP
jgi:UPF0755 protein